MVRKSVHHPLSHCMGKVPDFLCETPKLCVSVLKNTTKYWPFNTIGFSF